MDKQMPHMTTVVQWYFFAKFYAWHLIIRIYICNPIIDHLFCTEQNVMQGKHLNYYLKATIIYEYKF